LPLEYSSKDIKFIWVVIILMADEIIESSGAGEVLYSGKI
jgi:hypothetical protein